MHGALLVQDDRREVPLLASNELRLLFSRQHNRCLVFNVEKHPAVVERFVYHADKGRDHELFDGLYTPDPKYAKKP